jgi:lactocepin
MNTFKRTIAMIISFCLIAVLFPAQALAASSLKLPFTPKSFSRESFAPDHGLKAGKLPSLKGASVTWDGFIYSVKDDKVTILGYKGDAEDITVPDTIDSKPVTTIAAYAFSYLNETDEDIDISSISSVKIGPNITYIGKYAFYGQQIEKFTVDAANTKYASDTAGALFNYGKTVLMNYPTGSFTTGYSVPEGVTQIDAYAFEDASELDTVSLPQSLVTIGEGAFTAAGIKTISIPKTVTSIGKYALSSLENLTAVTVDAANTKYFAKYGVLFDKAQKTLLLYPAKKTGASYSIPGTVTKITAEAFNYCQYLQVLNIPASVTVIEKSQSMEELIQLNTSGVSIYCLNLKSINVSAANTKYASHEGVLYNKTKTNLLLYPNAKPSTSYILPSTVKYIDPIAFANSTLLKAVKLPASLITIGDMAFTGSSITSVTIPKNVTSIGKGTFLMSAIKSLTFNSKLTTIPDLAFAACMGLTSVTIPKNIRSIGLVAFASCTALKTVTIPYTTITIDDTSFALYDTPTITIRGCKNSVAQAYAKKLEIPFKSIGSTPSYRVKASVNSSAYGTVSGANKYYYGKTCKLKATPKTGYKFVKWTAYGKTVSTKAEYSFTVTKARTLQAVFAKK